MDRLVSVIVPVYNMGDCLEKCIKSILDQDYSNFELILVDDGSKDNSLSVCNKLKDMDERISVIHTDNRGSGPARNTGIEHSKGEYLYFPDADDFLEPNALSLMVKAMLVEDVDLVVFGFKNVDLYGNVVIEKKYEDRIVYSSELRNDYSECLGYRDKWGIQGAPWNKLFKASVVKDNNISYPSLRRHQDEGFISRFMCYSKKVHFIEPVLYKYYVNDLKKEWDKYPIDYIDIVMELYKIRKETIYTWNKNDHITHEKLTKEYICNIIKSLELTFSNKHNLNKVKRKETIVLMIKKAKLDTMELPSMLGKYQSIVMSIIKNNNINLLYALFSFKVFVEKKGLLNLFRKG